MLRTTLALITAMCLTLGTLASSAFAGDGTTTCRSFGQCTLVAKDPGSPGTSSPGAPAGGGSSHPAPQCSSAGQAIPCAVNGAYWSGSYGCYITPTAVDPAGAGFTPEQIAAHPGQSLHQCVPYNLVAGGRGIPGQGYYRWLAAGTPAAAVVDPAVLARAAVEQMNLRPVDVGLAPPAGALGLVGLPVYMWADNPGDGTWQAARTVRAGTVSVTAKAQVQRVEWDMGDGSVVTCGKGSAYDRSRGAAPSPDCGHTYSRTSAKQSGGAYTVTATSFWTVQWTANTGASGVIDLQLATSAPLRIGESQVIVTGG